MNKKLERMKPQHVKSAAKGAISDIGLAMKVILVGFILYTILKSMP